MTCANIRYRQSRLLLLYWQIAGTYAYSPQKAILHLPSEHLPLPPLERKKATDGIFMFYHTFYLPKNLYFCTLFNFRKLKLRHII